MTSKQSQTPRQKWAQQRLDDVYANNGHPYFSRTDWRKKRLTAAMLKLHEETTPPARLQEGQRLTNAARLFGDDAFTRAEDAADYLSQAVGNGAAPRVLGASDLSGGNSRTSLSGGASLAGSKVRSSHIAAIRTGGNAAAAVQLQTNGITDLLRNPTDPPKEPANKITSDQADAAPPPRTGQNPLPTILAYPVNAHDRYM